MKKIILLILIIFSFQIQAQKPLTAILGAFRDEVKLLEDSLQHKQEVMVKGIRFVTGDFRGRPLVVALTGVGKVNAAMTTTILLMNWQPQQLIFTGIAGGVNAEILPGDMVIAKSTIQHDFGKIQPSGMLIWNTRNPIDGVANPMYFPADSVLLLKAQKASNLTKFKEIEGRKIKVKTGIVATGDVFVNSDEKVKILQEQVKADATEMEGAAVAQVCYQLKIPCLILRSISDNANSKAHVDMNIFGSIAAYNSANLVLGILGNL
jgi:adenosylhomocysteine nucleosidase